MELPGDEVPAQVAIMSERERLVPTFVKFIEQLHPNPENILDVGCGPLRDAFRRQYGKRYTGLDLLNTPYPKDIVGDAHKMPRLKDQSYDVVTAWSVLEHLHNPAIALKEMFRITRHVLIISTDLTRQDQDGDPTHLYCWTPKVFRQFLNLAEGHHTHVWTESNILFGAVKR